MKNKIAHQAAAAEPVTYLLRDIDPAIWEQFKRRAEGSGVPMRKLLLELVAAFATGAIEVEQEITVRTRKATTR